jgi:O-antigen/teichoic acid export membrane protein
MKLKSFNPTAAKQTMMAVADRALLGAVTFLTSIVLGRWGGPGELGLFAIFFSLVFLGLALQESLVIVPFSILAPAKSDPHERRRYLGGVLGDGLILGVFAATLFVLGGLAVRAYGLPKESTLCLVLALAAPCILLREFARRIVYTDLRPQAALQISATVSVLQLLFLGVCYAMGQLTAVSSIVAMGASSLIGGLWWLVTNMRTFEFGQSSSSRRTRYVEHWRLGRWLLAGQAGDIVRINMLPWLLALVTDDVTVGIYAACSFVASLPTPLHVAISNMLVPQMAQLERRSGLVETDRLVRKATQWLTAAMVVYAAAVIAVSAHLVTWIYGHKFTGTQHPLIVLVLAWAVTGGTLPTARALLIIKRADQSLWSQLAGIGVNLTLGAPMVMAWGATGAAYAALLGSVVKGGLGCWWYAVGVKRLVGNDEGSLPAALNTRDRSWSAGAGALATEAAP